ncbi:PucR family transcriptional regulator ligand-binding domain-containing protein [Bacillus sp. DTU_2020_1000418_1_SI_GHA_SEK_038]|uniref:PucR family transcriptional regulator n=1 Tax=Bacillus sp. DTU_2020_1000418_1_SI_GHA_SEK_038 TaxID=3077585 RepID=UPI0028EC5061|nr:PucR family transcriptional regulator ligand-binding domain-containing protein [Bacillus sp. DTU_2020_1000418_1_SI_GHA_SEK_038]WNS76516.1 PucR family transcriptional regulator ligand-binding domain-containing protein [Bacillus sp. DTU_2020_1000418_1_SI_GHA_SEK_038]
MEFRIKDLLKFPSLKDAVVLSGKNHLNKVIKGTTIMEAPDITNWLTGGELVLTSLYPVRNFSEEEHHQFIAQLAEKGVSVLVIKIHRFVSEIPMSIINAGEKSGLTIIQLPKEVPYVDVMYPVMGELFNNQVKKLQYYKEIHDRFTELSLADEGLEKIIKTLEQLIGNPVALFDRHFHCIETTFPSLTEFKIIEKVSYYNQKEGIKFPHYRQIVKYPALNGQKGFQIVVPIETINRIKTYLLIGEFNKPLQELDLIAVENCAISLSLELVKQFAVAEVNKKFKNDLIDELIGGKVQQMNVVFQKANVIGWDLSGSFAAVLFKISSEKDTTTTDQKENNRILSVQNYELVYEAIHHYLPDGIIRSRSDFVIVLWKISDGDLKAGNWMDHIKDTARKIQISIKNQLKDNSVRIGIGSLQKSIMEIPQSFKEAQDALEIGEIIGGKEAITVFSELGIFRLLYKLNDSAVLSSFIPQSLQKLLHYQHANKKDLLITLKTFLECNQNATKTSQILYIHQKTAVYRLERIKDITGMNFEDPEEMLSVQIGLKIVDILNRKEAVL